MKSMTPVSKPQIVGRERPADLPEFERPPVVEVVLGIQFADSTAYHTWHAGLLWESTFRARFPKCFEQPPLNLVFETFGTRRPERNVIEIQQRAGPVVPRLWFVKDDESELIQFQSNRFLYNWRQYGHSARYPRYEHVRERFFMELDDVISFFDQNNLGQIDINQCEISYVNHIRANTEGKPRVHLEDVLTYLHVEDMDVKLSSGHNIGREGIRLSTRSIVFDTSNGEPVGRLHIEAEPAVELDGTPIIRLGLTARGNPLTPTLQGVADFFDIGREAIVRSFTSMTTQKMHEMWGRKK